MFSVVAFTHSGGLAAVYEPFESRDAASIFMREQAPDYTFVIVRPIDIRDRRYDPATGRDAVVAS